VIGEKQKNVSKKKHPRGKSKRMRKAQKKHGKKPSSFQPKAGSTVLHCGHLHDPNTDDTKFHWWNLRPARPFKRPDGTEGESEWITACEPCFLVAKGQVGLIEVRGDGTWLAGEDLKINKPFGDVKQIVPLGAERDLN
jgi:hypothetical protein